MVNPPPFLDPKPIAYTSHSECGFCKKLDLMTPKASPHECSVEGYDGTHVMRLSARWGENWTLAVFLQLLAEQTGEAFYFKSGIRLGPAGTIARMLNRLQSPLKGV